MWKIPRFRSLYQYMPVQAAANNMFDPEQHPYLRELCTLDDEGMQKLTPDGSRGRKRILILVSDSTTFHCCRQEDADQHIE